MELLRTLWKIEMKKENTLTQRKACRLDHLSPTKAINIFPFGQF